MKGYVSTKVDKGAGSVSVIFDLKDEKVKAINAKLKALDERADMNGHNWEALLNFYLDEKHPMVAGGMGSDPETNKYIAYYKLTPQNEKKAEQLAAIIEDLVEHEDQVYDIVKNNADEIEWD
jgi:hypothetical protein